MRHVTVTHTQAYTARYAARETLIDIHIVAHRVDKLIVQTVKCTAVQL